MLIRASRAVDATPPASGAVGPPEVPAKRPASERRHYVRALRAPELDRCLRRLARQEARCRLVLGRLAGRLLQRRAHHRLGFVRLGDYSRERLGLSAREVQSMAHVVEAAERLPGILVAFSCGEISWTQLRMLAAAATADTEQQWLALARASTVRALEAPIREAANACARGADANGLQNARGAQAELDDCIRERLGTCPRKARMLVALDRECNEAPVLAEAYRRGEVSWLQALTLLPVVCDRSAAPEGAPAAGAEALRPARAAALEAQRRG